MKRQESEHLSCFEIERLIALANRKLARIIQQEGDDGGQRLEPWYLAEMLGGVIQEYLAGEDSFARNMRVKACAGQNKS